MRAGDQLWTRGEWARWFIERDEVYEAARVLEPGDELTLGRCDYLDLAAALSCRGLVARYQERRVTVLWPDVALDGPRKPPLRAVTVTPIEAKKNAR